MASRYSSLRNKDADKKSRYSSIRSGTVERDEPKRDTSDLRRQARTKQVEQNRKETRGKITQTSSPTFTTTPTLENLPRVEERKTNEQFERERLEKSRATAPGRNIPIIGDIQRALDKVADFVKPATDVAQEYYTPGAGLGVIQGLTRGVEYGVARALPKLVNTVPGRITQTALTEGIVGVPLQAANTLTRTGDLEQSAKEGLLYGGLGGAVLGGAGRAIGEGVQGLRSLANNAAQDVVQGNIRAAMDEVGVLPRTQKEPIRTTVARSTSDVPTEPVSRYSSVRESANESVQSSPKVADESIQVPTATTGTPVAGEVESVAPTVTNVEPTAGVTKQQGERSFLRTLEQAGRLTKEQVEQSKERFYDVQTVENSLAKATQRLDRKGIDSVESTLLNKKTPFNRDDVTSGSLAIDELLAMGENERAITLSESLAKKGTELGQAIQAFSIIERLSPQGLLVYASRKVNELEKTLSPVHGEKMIDLGKTMEKSGASQTRSISIQNIAEKIINKQEPTPEELAELTNFIEDAIEYISPPKATKSQAKPVRKPSDKKIREEMMNSLVDKEAQLKAFIRQNTNRVSANPLDVWSAYAALGAVKLAKGTISFSKWAEEMIKDAGEGIRPHLSKIFDRSQKDVEQLYRLVPDKTTTEKIAKKYIEAGQITPKDAWIIHDLASKIGKMNMNDKRVASRQVQEILNTYEKGSVADKINAFRYIQMLGNTGTQLLNAVSSPIAIIGRYMRDILLTPFDWSRSKMFGTDRKITFKQGPNAWDNFFSPIGDYLKGAVEGGSAGWKGIDPDGITSQTDIKGLAFKSKFNPFHWAEKSLGAVMKGADYGAYNAAVQTKLRQMAYLDALNKGVKGADNIRRYMDRYLNNMDDNIVEMADRVGKELTFQNRSKASQGAQAAVRGLNKFSTLGLTDKTGLGSALLPFVKTPTNLLIGGLERTPLGVLKGIYQLSTMAKNPNISGAEIADTFAKAILGTVGLTGTGYVLGNLGILTGDSASTNKDVQKLEESIGKGKFKFNTTAFARMMNAMIHGNFDDIKDVSKFRSGDKQLNYNSIQPFAFPTAMGATFAEQQRNAQSVKERGGNVPLSSQLLSSAAASGQSIYDMSLLKGLQDAFDVQPGDKAVDIFKRAGQNYLKSFSSSLFGQEARRQDPTQRATTYKGTTEPVTEYFQSRLPKVPLLGIEGSTKLPPRVNALGEPLTNPTGFFGTYVNPFKQKTTDYSQTSQKIYDLIQKTGDEGLAPKPLDKDLSGKKNGKKVEITLNTRELAELQQSFGKVVNEKIGQMPSGTPEEQSKWLLDLYEDARKVARDQFKKSLGWD